MLWTSFGNRTQIPAARAREVHESSPEMSTPSSNGTPSVVSAVCSKWLRYLLVSVGNHVRVRERGSTVFSVHDNDMICKRTCTFSCTGVEDRRVYRRRSYRIVHKAVPLTFSLDTFVHMWFNHCTTRYCQVIYMYFSMFDLLPPHYMID